MEINRNNYESWFLDYHEGTLAPEKVAELFAFLEDNPDLRAEFEEFEMISILAPSDIPNVTFGGKEQLLRDDISDDQAREWMLDILEGQRTDKTALLLFLDQRSHLRTEWEQLQLTKLKADTTISFPSKSLLKKNEMLPQDYEQLIIGSLEGDLNLQERTALSAMMKQYPQLENEKQLFAAAYLKAEKVEFPGKQKLLKKEAKVIGIYIKRTLRIAAVIVVLLGSWFLLNREADVPTQVAVKNPPVEIQEQSPAVVKENQPQNSGNDSDSQSSGNVPAFTPEQTLPEEIQLANNSGTSKEEVEDNRSQPDRVSDNPIPNSDLAFIEPAPRKSAIIQEEEPFVDVQRRPYHGNFENSADPVASFALQSEIFVKNAVNTAENKVQEVANKTPLASDVNGTKLTMGSRVIRSVAWVVGKATDDRIKIKTTFNPHTGSLAAYEVEAANRKWQKQF